MAEKYYQNEKYCLDQGTGIDREGLFRVICDINGLEVPDDVFRTEEQAAEPQRWQPKLSKRTTFDVDAEVENFVWPEQGTVESWPLEKEIKLQKIYFARVIGDPEVPLIAIQLQFTNGIKSPVVGRSNLSAKEPAGAVEMVACDTDFS